MHVDVYLHVGIHLSTMLQYVNHIGCLEQEWRSLIIRTGRVITLHHFRDSGQFDIVVMLDCMNWYMICLTS